MPPVAAFLAIEAAAAFTAATGVAFTAAGLAVLTTAVGTALAVGATIGLSALQSALKKSQSGPAGTAGSATGTSPPPEATQQTINQAIPSRFRHYGTVKVGGALGFRGVNNGVLFDLMLAGQGKIAQVREHWLNSTQVFLDGSDFVTDTQYLVGGVGGSPTVKIVVHDGDDNQAADPDLLANFSALAQPWTANHRLRGIALVMVSKTDVPPDNLTTVYPSGPPAYRLVADFTFVYDPRDGTQDPNDKTTWKWSDNAALVILDFLTHADGFNRPRSQFNTAMFIAAANSCDDAIPLKAGGTEPRYRIHNTYDLTEKPSDVLDRYLAACDGYLQQQPDGTYGLKVGIWETPTVTIADADILSYSLAQGNNALAAFNVETITFTYSVNDYQTTQAQDWEDADSIALYGERTNHLDLPAVPSPSQARRLGKIAMAKGNPQWIGQVVCSPRGMLAIGERNVTIQIAELGINQTFFVTKTQIAPDLTSCTIDVLALDASAYSWDPASEEGDVPISTANLAFGGPPQVPGSFTFTGVLGPTFPGTSFKYVVLSASWNTAGVRTTLTAELNWRRIDGSPWSVVMIPVLQTNGWQATVPPLSSPQDYEARVRFRGPSGMPSDWSATITVHI